MTTPHQIQIEDLDGWKAEVLFASSSKEQKRLYIVSFCNWHSIDSHYEIRHKDQVIFQTTKLDEAVEHYNSITN